jgi:hypothetical protein
MKGEGDDLEARVRIFNFDEKRTVFKLVMLLHYLGPDGKELEDFPYTWINSLGPKAHVREEIGAFIPKETAKVEVEILQVHFNDKTEWKKP